MSDSANVIVGSATLRVAPIGTTLPVLDGSVYPIVWDAAWEEVGYTDDGVEFVYAPTFKDITVDEEMSPVKKPLTSEKVSINAKLAEATLSNMNKAIAGSTLTTNSTHLHDVKTLKGGSSQENNEVMVAFDGPAPGEGALRRYVILYRAKNTAQVQNKYQRADKVICPVDFEGLPDSSKPAGERTFMIVDVFEDLAS